jgi:hypothetical protein
MDAQRGEGRFAIRLGANSHLFEQLANPIREQHPCADARKLLDTLAELKIGDVRVVLVGSSQQLVVGKRNPGRECVRELDPRAIGDAICPGGATSVVISFPAYSAIAT